MRHHVDATAKDGLKYRLGLDLGTNPIGLAAVKLDDSSESCGVLDLGVRVFSDGRNPKDDSSLAVQRRTELLDTLVACGLMPPDEEARQDLARLDPYQLRERALDQPLPPFELGCALVHLNQRRGFKSNRKAGASDDESKTRADMDALGEFLARRRAKSLLVRARPGLGTYPDRSLYEAEFDAIRHAQTPHHTLREDQWESLKDITLCQRPLKPVDPGWCLLEAGERRPGRLWERRFAGWSLTSGRGSSRNPYGISPCW